MGSPILEEAGWKSVFITFSSLGFLWAALWRWCLVQPLEQTRFIHTHDEEDQLTANGPLRKSQHQTVASVPWGKLAKAPAIW